MSATRAGPPGPGPSAHRGEQPGGQYEWDSAAPVAVAHAAGLHASRVDGSVLRYNQPDPWAPDLLVCEPGEAGSIVELIGRHRMSQEAGAR